MATNLGGSRLGALTLGGSSSGGGGGGSGSLNASASNTLTLTQGVFRYKPVTASSTIVFSASASHNEINKATSNTLAFTQMVTGGITNFTPRVRTPVTFVQTVAPTIRRNLSLSNSILFAHTTAKIFGKPVAQTITFGEIVVGIASKAAAESLAFGQNAAVSLYKVRLSFANLVLHQTATVNTVLNLSASNTIGLSGRLNRNLDFSVTSTVGFGQLEREVDSRNAGSTLTFTEQAINKRAMLRALTHGVLFEPELDVTKTIIRRGAQRLALKHKGKLYHLIVRSADNTLALSHELVNSKYLPHVTDVFALSQALTLLHGKPVVAHSVLSFGHAVQRNLVLGRVATSTLTFPTVRTIPIRIADMNSIQVNNVITTVISNPPDPALARVRRLMTLETDSDLIVLPQPLFGDRLGGTDSFAMSFSMNNVTYSYVKRIGTKAFGYEWDLSYRKSEELADFIWRNNGKAIKIVNWKGEIWWARLTNNPIQLTDNLRVEDCDSKVNVSLEFEGVRVH